MEVFDCLKEAQRMCKSYPDCKGCPLINSPCGFIRCLEGRSDAEMRCEIKVVEQWSKEHQIITNAQKLKEVFGFLPDGDVIFSKDYFRNAVKGPVLKWDEPYEGAEI